MMKTVFAFALLATSGAALAYQEQPAPTEESAEAMAPAEETVAAEPAAAVAAPSEEAAPAPAEEAAPAEAESGGTTEEDYRAAVKAFRKCRQTAQMEGGVGAARTCNSKREDMIAAKEALREGK